MNMARTFGRFASETEMAADSSSRGTYLWYDKAQKGANGHKMVDACPMSGSRDNATPRIRSAVPTSVLPRSSIQQCNQKKGDACISFAIFRAEGGCFPYLSQACCPPLSADLSYIDILLLIKHQLKQIFPEFQWLCLPLPSIPQSRPRNIA